MVLFIVMVVVLCFLWFSYGHKNILVHYNARISSMNEAIKLIYKEKEDLIKQVDEKDNELKSLREMVAQKDKTILDIATKYNRVNKKLRE